MRNRRSGIRRLSWSITLSSLGLLMTGCGGGHGSSTTPLTDPLITNLNVASGQTCSAQGLTGHVRTITFNFADAEGDVGGGHADLSLAAGSNTQNLTVGVPSANGSVSGSTSGTVTLSGICIVVVGGTATLNVSLTDSGGHTSNTLSAGVSGLQPHAGSRTGSIGTSPVR